MTIRRAVVLGALAIGFVACGSDSETPKKDASAAEAGVKRDVGTPDNPVIADGPAGPDGALVKDGPGGLDGTQAFDTQMILPDGGPGIDAPIVADAPVADAPVVDAPIVDVPAIDATPAVDGGPTLDGSGGEPRPNVILDGGTVVNGYYVELKREKFQTAIEGKFVDLYTIKNSKGAFAKISNMGAKLEQIVVPDRNGVFGDVILGYDSYDGIKNGQASMGAFIGRYANRIGDGTFTLDGTKYSIAVNEAAPKNNLLHGGAKGSRYRVFDVTLISDASVKMTLTFLDAEDGDNTGYTGFPGKVEMSVTYSITESNEIHVDYTATTNKKTVINMTSESFFNLGNVPTTPILDHVITVDADKVLAINDRLLPTGEQRDVTGTPMDFRTAKPFGKDYAADYDLLKMVGGGGAGVAGGYDNHYVLNKKGADALAFAASAYEPVSGRMMEVWSTEPGMQLSTGNNLEGKSPRDLGKGGVLYQKYDGFCMEPSHFPDSPNQPTFPSTVLLPSQPYTGSIVYKFGVK